MVFLWARKSIDCSNLFPRWSTFSFVLFRSSSVIITAPSYSRRDCTFYLWWDSQEQALMQETRKEERSQTFETQKNNNGARQPRSNYALIPELRWKSLPPRSKLLCTLISFFFFFSRITWSKLRVVGLMTMPLMIVNSDFQSAAAPLSLEMGDRFLKCIIFVFYMPLAEDVGSLNCGRPSQ